MNKTLLLISMLLSHLSSFSHKIVYLISPPRSSSVAFLRMMHKRGDFKIMHEPSQLSFILNFDHIELSKWFRDDAPRTFKEVKEKIFDKAKDNNVFVKEISFAVKDFLINDKEFLQNPDIYFIFLARNPHHSLISFYNKATIVDDKLSFLIGYKTFYEILHEVQNKAKNKPLIILAEDLNSNPHQTVESFCKHVGIEFKEDSLIWDNLGTNFEGAEEWNEIKQKDATQHWHGYALQSTGFGFPNTYEVDENGQPTFTEIKNEEHLKICKKAYEENLFYYNLVLKEKNKKIMNN